MNCTDFLGNILLKGDWVVRAERSGTLLHLVYSHIEEEPKPNNPQNFSFKNDWKFYIVTYDRFSKKFGKKGKAERNDLMVVVKAYQVPDEIRKCYYSSVGSPPTP